MTEANPSDITFNARDVMRLYLAGEYDRVSEKFLEILDFFSTRNFAQVPPDTKLFLGTFFANFLNVFTQPDFVIADPFVARFIAHNRVIADLVALTTFQTTEAFLEILRP